MRPHADRPTAAEAAGRWRRRDLLRLGAGLFVVGSVPLVLARRRAVLVRRTLPVMGTIADLAVVAPEAGGERQAHAALDAAARALRFVDATMTRHAATSEVGRVNAAAGRDGVAVGEHTARVLAEALRWAEGTEGAFDPCLGGAAALWDVGRRDVPPPEEAVRPLAGRHLWRALDLDTLDGRRAARLTQRDAALDLGGIAKGYGVDLAVAALRRNGVARALVNVGGDLYALGASEDGDRWEIGIRDPQDPAEIVDSVALADEAVATSGDYEQAFVHGGRRYHHLLDPATAAPRETTVHSVSVVAPTCMAADAAATAAFVLPGAEGARVLARLEPRARIASRA